MNWRWLKNALVIAWIALTVSACCSSRQTAVSSVRVQGAEVMDSLHEEISQNLNENITEKEIVTVTVERNDRGDTVRMCMVTDRNRSRSMYDVRRKKEEVRVVRDTVAVEKRDSVYVANTERTNKTDRPSGFIQTLKWIFRILICGIVLVIVFKVKKLTSGRFF